MNWFELWYQATSKVAAPVSGGPVNFLNPATNAPYAVVQSNIGSNSNLFEVQVPDKVDVLIEWPSPKGITYAAQTNTGQGYTVSSPDSVTLM